MVQGIGDVCVRTKGKEVIMARFYIKAVNRCDDCPDLMRSAAGYQCAELYGEPILRPNELHHACPLPELRNYRLDKAEEVVDPNDVDYDVIEVD